jgi:hypothetical protein
VTPCICTNSKRVESIESSRYVQIVIFWIIPISDPTKAQKVTNNDEHFTVEVGKAYKCNSKVEITMSGGAKLDTYNLMVQAFKTSNGTAFDDCKLTILFSSDSMSCVLIEWVSLGVPPPWFLSGECQSKILIMGVPCHKLIPTLERLYFSVSFRVALP